MKDLSDLDVMTLTARCAQALPMDSARAYSHAKVQNLLPQHGSVMHTLRRRGRPDLLRRCAPQGSEDDEPWWVDSACRQILASALAAALPVPPVSIGSVDIRAVLPAKHRAQAAPSSNGMQRLGLYYYRAQRQR
jgi:hypothetical protein